MQIADGIEDRKASAAERFGFAGLVLDIGAHSLTDATGNSVLLTPAEFRLLAALVRGAGRALSRDHLMQAMAGRDAEAFDRSVDVLVGRLRRKVEPDPKTPRLIVTVPGVGYRFTERPAPGGMAGAPQPEVSREPDRPSLAVLPFANLSGDPEQDYFADGMVEEITTALSRVRWFFVIARNSSFTYKGRAVDVKQVGRELGVRYVLEGSVRKAGDRVRITAQLVETETGVHVWADRFDGVVENIFDLQDEITASVVGAIEPQLRDAELNRATRQRPTNPTAYDCFLRGMARYYAESRDENDRDHATAAARDRERSRVCAALRPRRRMLHLSCRSRVERRLPRATASWGSKWQRPRCDWDHAIPPCWRSPAIRLGYLTDEFDLSLSLTETALTLNPNSATALQFGGWARLYAGDPETAMVYLLRGTRLNPMDTKRFILDSGLAYACVMLGRYEEAVGWARKSLGSAPHWIFAAIPLAGALAMLRRKAEAEIAVEQLLSPSYSSHGRLCGV